MKLVLIHGAPAVGKLTVARYLHEHFDYKLLHNHLAVDLSLAIYDEFGDKDFFDFTNTLRRTVLLKAKQLGVTSMVMTYMTCYEDDIAEIEKYLNFFIHHDIDVFPVHLCPTKETILTRTLSEERLQSHKLSCPKILNALLTTKKFASIQHHHTLSIDNTSLAPGRVAQEIVAHIARFQPVF